MRQWTIRFQKMTFHPSDLCFCKNKLTKCLFRYYYYKILGSSFCNSLPSLFKFFMFRWFEYCWNILEPFSKKCDISFWQVCQRCEAGMGPKTEKNLFSLLNLSQTYGEMISFNLAKTFEIRFKFEPLKIA